MMTTKVMVWDPVVRIFHWALMVYNLLATLLLLGWTGYLTTTATLQDVRWIGDLHQVLANWAIFSVLLHVAGVFCESRRTKENLVKSMVTGYKKRERP